MRTEKLNDATLQKFLQNVRKEAQASEIVEKIRRDGLTEVVNEFFLLDDKQTANLKHANSSNELTDLMSDAVIKALQTGGDIHLRKPDVASAHQPRSTGVHVGVGIGIPGVGGVNVNIECDQ
jgi:hypothetical protein